MYLQLINEFCYVRSDKDGEMEYCQINLKKITYMIINTDFILVLGYHEIILQLQVVYLELELADIGVDETVQHALQ